MRAKIAMNAVSSIGVVGEKKSEITLIQRKMARHATMAFITS